jgi:glutaredoxin 3
MRGATSHHTQTPSAHNADAISVKHFCEFLSAFHQTLYTPAPAAAPLRNRQAKGLFTQLSVPAKVIECDVTFLPPNIHSVMSPLLTPAAAPLRDRQAKGLFTQLSVPAKVIECDVAEGGDKLREGLAEVTGRRTVPQVFIGGKHVGGCDGESSLHSEYRAPSTHVQYSPANSIGRWSASYLFDPPASRVCSRPLRKALWQLCVSLHSAHVGAQCSWYLCECSASGLLGSLHQMLVPLGPVPAAYL